MPGRICRAGYSLDIAAPHHPNVQHDLVHTASPMASLLRSPLTIWGQGCPPPTGSFTFAMMTGSTFDPVDTVTVMTRTLRLVEYHGQEHSAAALPRPPSRPSRDGCGGLKRMRRGPARSRQNIGRKRDSNPGPHHYETSHRAVLAIHANTPQSYSIRRGSSALSG